MINNMWVQLDKLKKHTLQNLAENVAIEFENSLSSMFLEQLACISRNRGTERELYLAINTTNLFERTDASSR